MRGKTALKMYTYAYMKKNPKKRDALHAWMEKRKKREEKYSMEMYALYDDK